MDLTDHMAIHLHKRHKSHKVRDKEAIHSKQLRLWEEIMIILLIMLQYKNKKNKNKR